MAGQGQDRRIRQMINFIEQEAREKADEINLKADHEFQIEKKKHQQREVNQTRDEYDRKMKNVKMEKKVEYSQNLQLARLGKLKQRHEWTRKVNEEATERLSEITRRGNYNEILRDLIVQGLIKLYEQKVEISATRADIPKVEKVLKQALDKLKDMWRSTTGGSFEPSVTVSKQPLPDKVMGGVRLTARRGRVAVDNTLDARLRVASNALLPLVRGKLFGVKFKSGFSEEEEAKHH